MVLLHMVTFFDHQLVHQAYGYEYQLPNITAYNETCASLGGVFWAYRMFQLEPKGRVLRHSGTNDAEYQPGCTESGW